MRALARVLVAGATLTIWTAGTGLAQHPQKRQGLWIGAGLGYGSLGRTCDACQNFPGEGGPSGYVKVGATPDPRVLMGIEVNGWRHDLQGTTVTSGNASFVVYAYPALASGFFLKGGLGVSLYREDTTATTGFGLTAGAGYDIRVGENLSLTPVANFTFGSLGNLTPRAGVFLPGVQQTLLQLALGVTFH